MLQWTSGRFQNPQILPVTGRTIQVDVINTRTDDALLLIAVEGDQSGFTTWNKAGNGDITLCDNISVQK